ncbi:MAG: phosphohistidine phosphatase SixA [Vulcanimicrobiaceae bacterium]
MSVMNVYFLRHGIAAERDEWQGADFDRPLTEEGHKRMARQAKAMAELSLAPDVILTSPLLRAKQTATIVSGKLHPRDGLIEDERLGLDFNLDRLSGVLEGCRAAGAVMLVGHEPSLSETIGRLIGGARIDLKKGALACVDVPDASVMEGTLIWLATPKILLA